MTNASMDKSQFSVTTFAGAADDDRAYWLLLTPQQRLAALERMRQINYAYNPATDRIQRTLEVAERT